MNFAAKRSKFLVFFGVASLLLSASAAAMAATADGSSYARHHHHGHYRHSAHAIYMRPQPASYIIDATTGKILESENPDSPRYPASLTKMMTLYLTFDALKKNKMQLSETIPISTHAASQPQTNIALQPGDRIAVKDAILSIVVRSANDSAVALGEAMGGGSEAEFAKLMTKKAHALGMSHTLFRNASGLPDPAQHTTARDMATLGRALRHDFPQYFAFFSTELFSYRGKTYVTHNHVMTRYDGVDGIKTGYIRAAGFNLVTSATRDGHSVIAVVLGGKTWKARDDKMIALLDKTFTRYAMLEGKTTQVAMAGGRAHVRANNSDEAQEGEGDMQNEELAGKPVLTGTIPQLAAAAPSAGAIQTASLDKGGNWGIQVGAYPRKEDAVMAAANAIRLAPEELGASTIAVHDTMNLAAAHVARLVNLTQAQAENACHKLTAIRQACTVYKAE